MIKTYKKNISKKTKTNLTKKIRKIRKTTYNSKDYNSGDGMLTSVWGPSLWHYLHVMSFNYPINPTKVQKKYYKQLLLNFQHT
jgi:hypothetical protein